MIQIKNDEAIKLIIAISKSFNSLTRLLYLSGELTTWARWIQQPSPGYVELQGIGPVSLRLVASIDLNPIEEQDLGRLLAKRRVDHSQKILPKVNSLGLNYSVLKAPDIIRFTLTG